MSPLENLIELYVICLLWRIDQLQLANRHCSNALIAIRRLRCMFEFIVNSRVVWLSNRYVCSALSYRCEVFLLS